VVEFTVIGCVPEVGSVPVPIAGAIVSPVAFVEDQVRFTIPPAFTVVVSALRVTVGATAVTVIVTVAVLLPPGPVAVAV
jgi:hypothetical protein